ncbi:MAG: lipopolysaccharide biosynthesis protein [Sphingobium sp.]
MTTMRARLGFLGRAGGFRSRMTSIGHLLSGNFMNAGIMLLSVAIAARTLGPHTYGIMVMVLTFGRTVERILRFESWQPVIKFAADHEEQNDKERLSQLYLYGLILDVGAACLAALATVALATAAGRFFGLSAEHVELVAIYSVALCCNINGMPTAALRFAGRFRTLAYAQVFANVLRIGLAAVCASQGYGLIGFLIAWTVAQVLGQILFIILGFNALAAQHIPNPLGAEWRGLSRRFPGFLSFAWSTNMSTTMRTFTQEADALLVGVLAGPAAAGMYHIAKRMAKVAQQAGAQVQAVLYPDMARIWVQRDFATFRSMILQIQWALAAIGVCALTAGYLLGDIIIHAAIGEAFADAYPLLLTQLVAVSLYLHAAPSRAALLAMGEHRVVMRIAIGSTMLFFAVAFTLIPHIGAMGANIAHIALGLTTAILSDIWWMRGSSPGSTARHVQQA